MKNKLIPIKYFNKRKIFFCIPKYIIKDFSIIYNLIEELDDLTIWQKNLILTRFLHIYKYIKNYYIYICRCYSFSKLFVIIVGIINPALLSINYDQNNKYYFLIYWTVWVLQLVVSVLTALISFFKWDKKYFLYTSFKTKIEQEIWLYLELSGKYSIVDFNNKDEFMDNKTTHSTKLKMFLNKIEYLYKKLKDSDLEIEDIDDESNDNESSSNEASQLIKRDLENADEKINIDNDYQQYILSQLKILLNNIKSNIIKNQSLTDNKNEINNNLLENKKKLIEFRKNNNEEQINLISSEIEIQKKELTNIEKELEEINILITNEINSDYLKIKNSFHNEETLINEIESFFNNNNINTDLYLELFK